MKEHHFFTEIAFIPWNWNRNDPKTIHLFSENPDYYAVCVHGCCHTGNEFGIQDSQKLNALSSTALQYMEQHKQITGLSYDPVIVFPQGRFSSFAIQALKDQGFHAAFNSTLKATDGDEIDKSEILKPATKVYHDLPLFLRRYPDDKEGFLQDLAFGRPIIIVEHHGAFKNGYKKLTDFIDWINGLGNVQWKSLSAITEYYCGKQNVDISSQQHYPLSQSITSKTKIALRRYACEFRDNFVEPNDTLSKIYQMLR